MTLLTNLDETFSHFTIVGMSLFRNDPVWNIANKLDVSLPEKMLCFAQCSGASSPKIGGRCDWSHL